MSVLALYNLPIFVFIASSVLSVLSFRHRIRHGPTTNTLVRQRRSLQFHQVLPPNEINSRVIVVGDVHGCLDELQALLVKCKYTDSDKVVLVSHCRFYLSIYDAPTGCDTAFTRLVI